MTPRPLARPFELVEQACCVFHTTDRVVLVTEKLTLAGMCLTEKVAVSQARHELRLAWSKDTMIAHESYHTFHLLSMVCWTCTPISICQR